jgi:AAA ATPase domain
MSGERLDYGIERQRHEGFLGREAVLAELDRLLVEDQTDRWVVVTGGPGMGKSAILAAWLARREAVGVGVPHHFIRRGFYGWDEPAKIMRSLAAQIEVSYPAQRDPDASPESRLVDLLSRVSARELVPRGERLMLLIDGLDEYDAPAGTYDPLAAFLPHALPRGMRLLCASRPRHPYLDAIAARDGELTRLDLDDPAAAGDNDATVRAFWRREAPVLGLGDRFLDEAVERADGNLQHAATLRKHLASVPPAQRRVEAIPRGLQAPMGGLGRRSKRSRLQAVCTRPHNGRCSVVFARQDILERHASAHQVSRAAAVDVDCPAIVDAGGVLPRAHLVVPGAVVAVDPVVAGRTREIGQVDSNAGRQGEC